MNYAIAFLGLIFLCALIFWYTGGRRYYTGPLIEAEVGEEELRDSSSGEEEKMKNGKSVNEQANLQRAI